MALKAEQPGENSGPPWQLSGLAWSQGVAITWSVSPDPVGFGWVVGVSGLAVSHDATAGAVGTPPREDGTPDMKYYRQAAADVVAAVPSGPGRAGPPPPRGARVR